MINEKKNAKMVLSQKTDVLNVAAKVIGILLKYT